MNSTFSQFFLFFNGCKLFYHTFAMLSSLFSHFVVKESKKKTVFLWHFAQTMEIRADRRELSRGGAGRIPAGKLTGKDDVLPPRCQGESGGKIGKIGIVGQRQAAAGERTLL